MKNKALQITIPDPCDQKWGSMEVVSDGRFCQQCSRTLVDFSQMTDRELVHFFNKNQGKVCGRFHREQLDKAIPLQAPQVNRSIFNSVGLALTGLLSTVAAQGQTTMGKPVAAEQMSAQNPLGQLTLEGIVTDHEGEPLIGATVVVENTDSGVITDYDGRFRFAVELGADAHLLVSYTGYEKVRISIIDFMASPTKTIKLETIEKMEEVYVVGLRAMVWDLNQLEEEKEVLLVDKQPMVEGIIVDENGEPLIGATIIFEGTQYGTITDFDGKFGLTMPEEFETKTVNLKVSYTGFPDKNITIDKADLPKKDLIIQLEEAMYLGGVGVVVVNSITYPATLVDWIKNLVYKNRYKRQNRKENRQQRREAKALAEKVSYVEAASLPATTPNPETIYPWTLKAFPNPFSEAIRLELAIPEAMALQLRLVDAKGQNLWSENQNLNPGQHQWQLYGKDLQLQAGTYYWQIEGAKGLTQVIPIVYTSN